MLKKHVLWICASLLVVVFSAATGTRADHWVYLGNAHVDQQEDHKKIQVGSADGSFHKLQLRVHNGAVEFQKVLVHFSDGTESEVAVNDRVRSGGKTHDLDLPGEHRTIDNVELWYSKEHFDQRPEVRLYGSR
jgi:hypothetical protein